MTEDNADIPSWIPGCPGIDQGTIYFTYAKAHMHRGHTMSWLCCVSMLVPWLHVCFLVRNCSLHAFESCKDSCEVVLLLLFGWFLGQKAQTGTNTNTKDHSKPPSKYTRRLKVVWKRADGCWWPLGPLQVLWEWEVSACFWGLLHLILK